MAVYLFIYIISLVVYFARIITRSRLPILFASFVLCLVLGFRGKNVGVDTLSYHDLFKRITLNEVVYVNEYGYVLFSKLIHYIGGNQQLIILVYAALTMLFFYKFITRYSTAPQMSLLIFVFVGPYYLASFNQMRQYLAIAVFLGYLLPLIEKRRFIRFLLVTVFTAFFSHITVLLTIPLYFILTKRWRLFTKFLIAILFIIGVNYVTLLILSTPYGYFLIKRADIKVETTMFLLQIFIAFIILFFEKRVETREANMTIFFNMALLSILMLFPIVLNMKIPVEIFARMNNYFFPFMMILVPEITKLFDKKSKQIINAILIFFLSLYYFKSIFLSGETYKLIPYDFNFNIFV